MTTAVEMSRLYHELADLPSTGAGSSGKPKSKPPISTEALDLRAEYEAAVGTASAAYVTLALRGSEFAEWALGWVGRCKVLTGELKALQWLSGAACLACEATEREPRKPAMAYNPNTRHLSCAVCDWWGELPTLG